MVINVPRHDNVIKIYLAMDSSTGGLEDVLLFIILDL